MKREDVYTVKTYFVNPVDLITVVINTLVEVEYQIYTVSETDSERLLKILPDNKRSIIFLTVSNRQETQRWLDYAKRAVAILGVQAGALVYSSMEPEERNGFLASQIPAISYSAIRTDTVKVLEQILTVFDARGMRRYVRVRARGISVAFVTVKGRSEPLRCNVTEISAYAALFEIEEEFKHYFEGGGYIPDVLLALRGIRVRAAVRVVGFSEANPGSFIVRFYGIQLEDGKMTYTERVPPEVRQKIHAYVRACLREEITEQLATVEP